MPGRRAAVRRQAAWAAVLPFLLCPAATWAQDGSLELAIKATYLVKFAAFVEWPANMFETPSSPLTICLVGTPFSGVADQAAAGQAAGQHPLAVRHVAAATHGSGCHILFSAGAPGQSIAEALDAVRGEPVLTVTDLPAATPRKGIIDFVLQSGHVRFEIDDRAAAQEGLRISSQLLALAINVTPR
jgi:hypothetical protein